MSASKVGGVSHENFTLQSAEVYDPQTNKWSHIPHMNIPRSHFGIGVVGNQLIVVGGHNGYTTLSSVECFDEDSGRWHNATSMRTSCCGLSCCVLHGVSVAARALVPS